MIVSFELEAVAARIEGDVETIRVGTDGTATTAADVALRAQVGSVAATVTRAEAVVTVTGVWTNDTGATKAIREYGLFDLSGNLLVRVAEQDADGGAGIVREVLSGEKLTIDAWRVTTRDG